MKKYPSLLISQSSPTKPLYGVFVDKKSMEDTVVTTKTEV